jgi:hypothetical protein
MGHDAEAAAAVGAGEDVDLVDALEQRDPCAGFFGQPFRVAILAVGSGRRNGAHHLLSASGSRTQDAVVAQQVLAEGWDLGGQPTHELIRGEEYVGLARLLRLGQLVGDAAVPCLRELGVGVRRTRHVSTQPLPTTNVEAVDRDTRVDREAVGLGDVRGL